MIQNDGVPIYSQVTGKQHDSVIGGFDRIMLRDGEIKS